MERTRFDPLLRIKYINADKKHSCDNCSNDINNSHYVFYDYFKSYDVDPGPCYCVDCFSMKWEIVDVTIHNNYLFHPMFREASYMDVVYCKYKRKRYANTKSANKNHNQFKLIL